MEKTHNRNTYLNVKDPMALKRKEVSDLKLINQAIRTQKMKVNSACMHARAYERERERDGSQ